MTFLDLFLILIVIANLSVILRAFHKHYWKSGDCFRPALCLVHKLTR